MSRPPTGIGHRPDGRAADRTSAPFERSARSDCETSCRPGSAPGRQTAIVASGVWAPIAAGGPAALDACRHGAGRAMHTLFQLLPDLPDSDRRRRRHAGFSRGAALARRRPRRSPRRSSPSSSIRTLRRYFGRAALPKSAHRGTDGRSHVGADRPHRRRPRDRILILDFKTDRAPPAARGRAARLYQAARRLSRGAQARFPGRPVTAALLWTADPRLMPIPDATAAMQPLAWLPCDGFQTCLDPPRGGPYLPRPRPIPALPSQRGSHVDA